MDLVSENTKGLLLILISVIMAYTSLKKERNK